MHFQILCVSLSFLLLTGIVAADTIDILQGSIPVIDGNITVGEWTDAGSVFMNNSEDNMTIYFKHDGSNLYIAFDILDTTSISNMQVLLDTQHNNGTTPQTDDHALTVRINGSSSLEDQGDGTGWVRLWDSSWGGKPYWMVLECHNQKRRMGVRIQHLFYKTESNSRDG